MIPTGNITYDFIKSLYQNKGYPFEKDNEVVNLFGYRSKELLLDQFNDILGIAYKDSFSNGQCLIFPGTTKPGLHYLMQELGNPKGTFILAEGFHADGFKIGLHNGYEALVQAGPGVFVGHRDLNSNGVLDETGLLYRDSTAIDLHRTRDDVNVTNVVDKFSAGCQVLWEDKHLGMILALVKRSFEVTKKTTLSYALFKEK